VFYYSNNIYHFSIFYRDNKDIKDSDPIKQKIKSIPQLLLIL
jgi:hypothetical protein